MRYKDKNFFLSFPNVGINIASDPGRVLLIVIYLPLNYITIGGFPEENN
jgi:hypothetical protein